MCDSIMKKTRSKIKLTSLNVGKIGFTADNLKDLLIEGIKDYKKYFIKILSDKKVKCPISLTSIRSIQGEANRNRRVLGLEPLDYYQELAEWKSCLIIRKRIKNEKTREILGVEKDFRGNPILD